MLRRHGVEGSPGLHSIARCRFVLGCQIVDTEKSSRVSARESTQSMTIEARTLLPRNLKLDDYQCRPRMQAAMIISAMRGTGLHGLAISQELSTIGPSHGVHGGCCLRSPIGRDCRHHHHKEDAGRIYGRYKDESIDSKVTRANLHTQPRPFGAMVRCHLNNVAARLQRPHPANAEMNSMVQ